MAMNKSKTMSSAITKIEEMKPPRDHTRSHARLNEETKSPGDYVTSPVRFNDEDRASKVLGRKMNKTKEEIVDINASAEAFINSFKQQLKIERLDSLENYKQYLERGL